MYPVQSPTSAHLCFSEGINTNSAAYFSSGTTHIYGIGIQIINTRTSYYCKKYPRRQFRLTSPTDQPRSSYNWKPLPRIPDSNTFFRGVIGLEVQNMASPGKVKRFAESFVPSKAISRTWALIITTPTQPLVGFLAGIKLPT